MELKTEWARNTGNSGHQAPIHGEHRPLQFEIQIGRNLDRYRRWHMNQSSSFDIGRFTALPANFFRRSLSVFRLATVSVGR